MDEMFKAIAKEIILQAVYLKLRFGLSYRDVEEQLSMRGVVVDHATWASVRSRPS